jgi:formylglycine-generating enzyme required for sulfatase activity
MLHLLGTRATHAGIRHLLKLENLEWLDMSVGPGHFAATSLGDLGKLPRLRVLSLASNEWPGDQVVEALAKLPNLRQLYYTVATDAPDQPDVAALRKALPNCRIETTREAASAATGEYKRKLTEEADVTADPDRRAANVDPERKRDAEAWAEILPPDAPSPAVAPFNAAEAKRHQQAWADYLGVPVEQETDLGGGTKLTMVLIPPGEFLMGSSAEEEAKFLEEAKRTGDTWSVEWIPCETPQRRVRITRPFRMACHEVTRGQFRQFVEETGYETDAERDGKGGYGYSNGGTVQDPRFVWNTDLGFPQTDVHPVVNMSWNDATAFCHWLSNREGVKYDLPTEAQWEYACRAGTTTFWHCGDREVALQEYDWFKVNSGSKTHPVGQLRPNVFGLNDMHGNVWEWCADWFAADYYANAPTEDPGGRPTGTHRVHRGGNFAMPAKRCRSADRNMGAPGPLGFRTFGLGFRVASVSAEK